MELVFLARDAIGGFEGGDLVVYYEVPTAVDRPLRARGYLTGVGYSASLPQGEHGDVHVSQVMAISAATFVLAREHGWPNTVQDRDAYPELAMRLALEAAAARDMR